MSNRSRTYLSVDEIIAYLKRSSQATALVEGQDDQKVYRYIEKRLSDVDLDILICEGREALLAIYRRRTEFTGVPVIFIADQDMWYFAGIPPEFKSSILFTEGYSIENDLYVRSVFEEIMSADERAKFNLLIHQVAKWQAFHVERFKKYGCCACDVHLNQVLEGDWLCENYLNSIGFIEPNVELVSKIIDTYPQALRGKSLFQLLLRILSATGRTSKFSRDNLIELGAKLSNPIIERLCERTRQALLEAGHSA